MAREYLLWNGNHSFVQKYLIKSLNDGEIQIKQVSAGGPTNKDFNPALETLLNRIFIQSYRISEIRYDANSPRAINMSDEEKQIMLDLPLDYPNLGDVGTRQKITSQLKKISGSATSSIIFLINDHSRNQTILKNLVNLGFIRHGFRNISEDDLDDDPWGFVYLMINPKFPGWVKIGKTQDYNSRLSTYQTGDPYRAYDMKQRTEVENRQTAELEYHSHFESISEERSYEWFKIGWESAGLEFIELSKNILD